MSAKYVDVSAIIQVIGNIYNNVSLLDYEEYKFCEDDFPESFHKILFGTSKCSYTLLSLVVKYLFFGIFLIIRGFSLNFFYNRRK